MVSERKRQANSANAKHSTGPRSAHGKAQASRNAKWHRLATPVTANQAFQAEINQLARAILESCGTGAILKLATRVAEAQVDLNRVRCARHQLISRALTEKPAINDWQLALSGRLDDTSLRELRTDGGTRVKIIDELTKATAFEVAAASSEEREARMLADTVKE